MSTFNSVAGALFDLLLAPFGHRQAWFDLLVWPILAGIVALLVYKRLSNQAGIARAKNGIVVNLLEVMLYKDDLVGVMASTGRAMGKNIVYLGHNILPMLVMFVPMMAILVQLVAHYALDPVPVGAVELVTARIDRSVGAVSPGDVRLELPEGIRLDAPPVRTPAATRARCRSCAPRAGKRFSIRAKPPCRPSRPSTRSIFAIPTASSRSSPTGKAACCCGFSSPRWRRVSCSRIVSE
jgi:hypothetical protein